jgi:hypothetical protein
MSKLLDDPMLLAQVAGSGLTLFAGIAAWISAAAARRAAAATERASQVHMLSELLDAYASPEMLTAMMVLRSWFSEHGPRSADEFRMLRQDNYPVIEHIDLARRRVSHFFHKVCALRTAGYMDETAVRMVATKGQVAFFREVIEPLEAAIATNYDRSCFEYLAGC